MINYRGKRQGTNTPGYQWVNQSLSLSSPQHKPPTLLFGEESWEISQQLLMGSKGFCTQGTSFKPFPPSWAALVPLGTG